METAGKHVDRESLAYEKLTGLKKHFCPDWDYMAIDETCDEMQACTCENPGPKAKTHCTDCGMEYGFSDESCRHCGFTPF